MKRTKLHQRLIIFFCIALIATSCSPKNFPAKDIPAATTEISTSDTDYIPPAVLNIANDKAKSNRDGELYYDDDYGYRYWRFSDGKFYLDAKYEKGELPNRKIAKKKAKKLPKNKTDQTNTEDYSSL